MSQEVEPETVESESEAEMENLELRPPSEPGETIPDLLTVNDLALEDPVRCIPYNRLDRTEILSRRYILFQVGRKEYYVNVLKRDCPSLNPRRRLLLETDGSRICNLDIVRVVTDDGFGTTRVFSGGRSIAIPGFSEVGACPLGQFSLVDEAGLDILKEQLELQAQLEKKRLKEERRQRKKRRKEKKEKS